jgi:hypothetical protein
VGYIDDNLITGEVVTYRARLHRIMFLKPILIALTIIAIAVLVFYAADLGATVPTQTLLIASTAAEQEALWSPSIACPLRFNSASRFKNK